jgi:cyclopropane fatty-acyl-phospholipid synthase-like methyltransferase
MNIQTSPSVSRNKEAILEVLKGYLNKAGRLLEVGSGTGEHAIFFGEFFNQIQWVTTDLKENHKTIKEHLKTAKLSNVHGPEKLKIGVDDFPKSKFDYVFSANTLHIMSWKEDKSFFKLLGKRLREGALVFFYGPFNYRGDFTSDSNLSFDLWLKNGDEKAGIRNFEDIVQTMNKYHLKLLNDHQMPSDNHILVFERMKFSENNKIS